MALDHKRNISGRGQRQPGCTQLTERIYAAVIVYIAGAQIFSRNELQLISLKKIRDFERYWRNQQRAARRRQNERHRPQGGSIGIARPLPRNLKTTKVAAPTLFSLIENPEVTLDFFARLVVAGNKPCRIFIDLEHVEKITIETVLLLLSQLKRGHLRKCAGVSGNEPTNQKVREMFVESGFYSFVTNKPANYRAPQGMLKKHEGKRVREDVAAELIHYATRKLFGVVRKNGGLYRALIECMANTKDHARIGREAHEAWWVSAYYDADTKIVHFAFLDNGVGIFKSQRMLSILQLLGQFAGLSNHADILMDVLEAKLPSRTGLPYRGKGLPAINRSLLRSDIRNLKIVTNTAFLDAATRKGVELKYPFKGTCLTWEIHSA